MLFFIFPLVIALDIIEPKFSGHQLDFSKQETIDITLEQLFG